MIVRFTLLFTFIVTFAVLFLVWPSQVDPAYWDEPPIPDMTGPLEPRGRLAEAFQIAPGMIMTSEDVAIGADGAVYTGQPDGRLIRIEDPGGLARVSDVAQVSAYPVLGLQWMDGDTLAAMAPDGLYRVNVQTGESALLVSEYEGEPFGFGDDLDVAENGVIYFTDASWKWGPAADNGGDYITDMIENRPYGRFYAFDPATGELTLLLDDLYFANGVAMSADQRSVFVVETYRYRLTRVWLEGPRAGESEIIAENMPGIPDGVMGDGQGRLYVAMDIQRSPILRFLHRNPFLTRQITKLPRWMWLRSGTPDGFVLVMDEAGNYLDSYHDPDGRFGLIANAVPHDGAIWIGSLTAPVIGRYEP